MNKPLTVKELKALKVGDWVWIICPLGCDGIYACKSDDSTDTHFADSNEFIEFECDKTLGFGYDSYGTGWIAYKNKEQAEAKGKIVELPCAIESDIFIKHENGIEVTQVVAMTLYEDIGFLHLANNKEIKVWFKDGHYSNGVERFESDFNFTFDKPKAKLRKLKGEPQE